MKWHNDSGHGWLEVEKRELKRLRIADKISSCSYQRGGLVYLEEDLDAGIFLEAFIAQYGVKPVIDEIIYEGDAPLRKYCLYCA